MILNEQSRDSITTWARCLAVSAIFCVAGVGFARADFSARWEQIKREAAPHELYVVLYDLPKGGDLHNHLGGSFFPEQWLAAATDPNLKGRASFHVRVRMNNCAAANPEAFTPYETIAESTWAALPECKRGEYKPLAKLDDAERAGWTSFYQLDRPGEGRYTFFAAPGGRVMEIGSDPVVVTELLVQNMKLYGAEGVRYLEYQAPPFGFRRPDGTAIDAEEAARIYEERLAKADARASGVEVRFLITAIRFAPTAEAQVERAYDFISKHRERWVGVNMAGIEERGTGYPSRFLETFRKLRRTHPGVGISIHAGEMDGPNSHVRDTLLLGASRIGHGVTLIKDADTMLLLRGGHALVEINLISNQLLEYVPNIDQHPFPEYLRTGIPVCLNTDDRGWWGSTMTDEYFVAVSHFNLAWDEIVQLGRASLEHSFLDAPTKAKLLADYARDVAAFEARYGAGDWRAPAKDVKPVAFGYAARQFGLTFSTP